MLQRVEQKIYLYRYGSDILRTLTKGRRWHDDVLHYTQYSLSIGKGAFPLEKGTANVDRTTLHDQECCVMPWMSLSPEQCPS
jgi:hypothetical protein